MSAAQKMSEIDKLSNLYWETFAPSQKLSVQECAERYRVLTSEASEKTGPWDTSVVPYTSFPMALMSDPDVREIILMWPSQSSKTEMLLNFLMWTAICSPGPTSVCYAEKLAAEEDLVAARIEPMIAASPMMAKLFFSAKARGKGRKLRYSSTFKSYVGGYMKFGHPSPTFLAGRPTKYFIFDELSRGIKSFNKEGDYYSQAKVRTSTFTFPKILAVSSPGDEGSCPTEALYQVARQYVLRMPCPHCEKMIALTWEQLRYTPENTDSAYYECQECKAAIQDEHKPWMLARHEWHCLTPERSMRMIGMNFEGLSSPWLEFKDLALEYVLAQKDQTGKKMKTFINTRLARVYRNERMIKDSIGLHARREEYTHECPLGTLVLTCAVDVNDFGLAYEVKGWGHGEENWSIEYKIIHGSPTKPEVWEELSYLMSRRFKHALGLNLYISRMAVDVNYLSSHALAFVQAYEGRCFGIKGEGRDGTPIVGKILRARTGQGERHYNIFEVGVNEAKELIYDRLAQEVHGPGYCHFPNGTAYTQQFFQELTSEYKALEKDRDGFTVARWKKREHLRNEPLDVGVYNLWCIRSLQPHFEGIEERLMERKAKVEERFKQGDMLDIYEADLHLVEDFDDTPQYKEPERSVEDFIPGRPQPYKAHRRRRWDW